MLNMCPFVIPMRINIETGEKEQAEKKTCNFGKGTWCASCAQFNKSKVGLKKYLKHRDMMKKTGLFLPQIWAKNRSGVNQGFKLIEGGLI